jgi:anti-sigma factor RsiW
MSDCQDLAIREQLPELLHGALDDAEQARVQAHLEWCRACADELEIMRAVLATASTPTVDVSRIAAAIPPYAGDHTRQHLSVARGRGGRSRTTGGASAPHRSWYSNAYLRVAAGFLIAAIGVSGVAITHRPTGAPAAHVSAAPSTNGVSLVGVSDLSDDNLEQLIQSMDNLDATPPAEPDPEPVTAAGGSA